MNNGEKQAYPSTRKYNYGAEEVIEFHSGLTKREYFAGLAMQGLLACPNVGGSRETLVKGAIDWADELLKQLENETTK